MIKRMKKMVTACAYFGICSIPGFGNEFFDRAEERSSSDLVEQEVESEERTLGQLILDCMNLSVDEKKQTHLFRDYNKLVTPSEKENIGYIVTTLGHATLGKIASSRSSLKKAGEKINQVHPLRFLMCVYTNEKFKAGIHGIYSRGGWIGTEFFDGLKLSFTEESARNNMRQECIEDFARGVGIDVNLILPPITQQRWNDFIALLMVHLPRAGDTGRYGM